MQHKSTVSRVWAGIAAVLIAIGAGLSLGLSPGSAADPARPYLGMTKEEIVACAGQPHGRIQKGNRGETLTYRYSGAGPVPAAAGEKKKKERTGLPSLTGKQKGDKDWDCTASLVFENGRLVRVSHAHKDVKSPYDWQKERDPQKQAELRKKPVPSCSFSLPNCTRQ